MDTRRDWLKKTGAVVGGLVVAPFVPAVAVAAVKPKPAIVICAGMDHGLKVGDAFAIFDMHVGNICAINGEDIIIDYAEAAENIKRQVDFVEKTSDDIKTVVFNTGDVFDADFS